MADLEETIKRLTQGLLHKELYLYHTVPAAPLSEIQKHLPEHLEYQLRLEKEGIMFAAGPLANEDGTLAGGMIVVRAPSFAAARAIAEADPMHRAGARTFTLRRWTVNEGALSVRVHYSDQTVKID
jgi:uncharacterized protein YciI